MLCIERSEDNLEKVTLPFTYVGLRFYTQNKSFGQVLLPTEQSNDLCLTMYLVYSNNSSGVFQKLAMAFYRQAQGFFSPFVYVVPQKLLVASNMFILLKYSFPLGTQNHHGFTFSFVQMLTLLLQINRLPCSQLKMVT